MVVNEIHQQESVEADGDIEITMPQASENLDGSEIIDNEEGSTSPPPAKMPRLLAKYRQHRGSHSNQKETITVQTQIAQYLEKIDSLKPEDISDNALEFWNYNRKCMPDLHKLTMTVLSIPALSAPVERAFSRGGIIFSPHRRRLSAHKLSMLIFFKCNFSLM